MTRTASCSCGQLQIALHGPLLGQGICHCLACQGRTGSVFATLAGFGAPWTVTGRSSVWERTGDAGGRFAFHFCPVCGSHVFHTEAGVEDMVNVAVGCLSDPAFPPPAVSVYDSRRHGWVVLPPGTRAFDRDPG